MASNAKNKSTAQQRPSVLEWIEACVKKFGFATIMKACPLQWVQISVWESLMPIPRTPPLPCLSLSPCLSFSISLSLSYSVPASVCGIFHTLSFLPLEDHSIPHSPSFYLFCASSCPMMPSRGRIKRERDFLPSCFGRCLGCHPLCSVSPQCMMGVRA